MTIPSYFDPSKHPQWLSPHSLSWYAQLGRLTGRYMYPWESTISEPNGESKFTEEVAQMVPGKKVLDIGCGHGHYAHFLGETAKEIVGVDVTSDFVRSANSFAHRNVSFVVANTKEQLPFRTDEFDCAYNRRGPTSAYPDCCRVVKSGGTIIGLHPGDQVAVELSDWFPILCGPVPTGTPILDNLRQRLDQSHFSQVAIESIITTEYLHSPLDVIRMRCFGQTPALCQFTIDQHLHHVRHIFEIHAEENGLPVTFHRYLVRVIV